MKKLVDYVMEYAERGACQCGKCIDAPEKPDEHQPAGHTADMIFFKVAVKPGADAETLKNLVKENVDGEFENVDMFDGGEHGYMEVGGWIGDQGTALTLMGMGTVLGLWKLLTPVTMLKMKSDDPMCRQMAGMGMVAVQASKG